MARSFLGGESAWWRGNWIPLAITHSGSNSIRGLRGQVKRPALNFPFSIPRIFTRKLPLYLFLHTLLETAKTDTLSPHILAKLIYRLVQTGEA